LKVFLMSLPQMCNGFDHHPEAEEEKLINVLECN
jgi:hypothetical protein